MTERAKFLIEKLCSEHSLELSEYKELILARDEELAALLAERAREVRQRHYGTGVYVRGLIEISNICKNDCLYCGIRQGNSEAERYRLTQEEILECCDEGYSLGFRTFVLQGGEDPYYTDEVLCEILSEIKGRYPECAVTLSLGERSRESYFRLFTAGADRYLLRHETACPVHYARLHPTDMSYDGRMRCLRDLKDIGYQVGCGFMVGSPYQTEDELAKDLKFIEEFSPNMCGIGPFIPHKKSVFAEHAAGSVELTCYLLSIIRLILPTVLLPATTALGTLAGDGRERGILSGANVVMPNLSPHSVRTKYELYNNKLHSGSESAEALAELESRLSKIGYHIEYSRGDQKDFFRKEGI